ncbi:thioesterase domain-containing protein [Actinacidiphila glaucinigra]|uniref:thioesterase domain-containing protein n=1 Tax=Actinacidiphila glaucinigra TaxID=235986 RepID=UPI0034012748
MGPFHRGSRRPGGRLRRRRPGRPSGRGLEAAFLGLSRPRPGRERQPGPADAGEDELIAELTEMGGTQAEVFLDAELRELVLPAIRADYRLLERYDVIPVAPHAGPWRSHVPGWCGPPVPPRGPHARSCVGPDVTASASSGQRPVLSPPDAGARAGSCRCVRRRRDGCPGAR